jgi:hydrogenase expression/formation protein HypC
MCIATPMRVLTSASHVAVCVDRRGAESAIDVTLVGPVEPGQWLLAFHGAAREVLEESRALQIDRALAAVEAAIHGDRDAIDAAFSDLVDREPQLPDFLR